MKMEHSISALCFLIDSGKKKNRKDEGYEKDFVYFPMYFNRFDSGSAYII